MEFIQYRIKSCIGAPKHGGFAVGHKFRKQEAEEQILLANSGSDFVC
jgi:hypothetical protein